ncbi:hypothetical protein Tco_0719668 [Tanacetum coccineum]
MLKVDAPSHSQNIPEAQVEVPSQEATVEDVEVPSNIASTAQHTASSLKKVGTKKKRLGRKGVHTSQSTIPIEEGDPEAEHKVCIKYASDADSASDDDTPVNLYAVVDWELLPTGLGSINAFYRLDNSRKYFTSLREILHLVTRADLMTIYGRVMTFYQDKKAAGVGLVLWGDLKVLMDSPEVNDGSDVWKNQHTWSIQSWKLYSFSGVHVLETVSGLVLHMFVDKKYPLSVNLIERMLDHQLEICHGTVGNELTTAVQLIAFLKKQISDSKRPKVHDWYFMKVAAFGVHAVNFLMLLQRLSPAIIRFLIQEVWSWFQDVAVQSSGIVTTSRYVVPTGRVKVPAGMYVVPTSKDNVIVSAGRSKVIPAGSSTPPRYSPGASKPPSYSLETSRNAKCSNCKHLLDKIMVVSSGWSFVSAVPGQMTYSVASPTLDSAGSYVMHGAPFTQRMIPSIPIGGSISPEGFLPSILLVVVIIVTVVVVVVIVILIVVVVEDVSLILKLSFEIIYFLHRIMPYYLIH